jgi:hydroxyethylthiazole kinase
MYDSIQDLLVKIKQQRPLILNITNLVTMDFIANGLLSLGASPIMTQSVSELHDLINIANGVVINIGTLNEEFMALAEQACQIAHQTGIPITFDPVGAGASEYRTRACLNLIRQFKCAIIRGNASEIMALYGSHQSTKGVDASIASTEALDAATYLSEHYETTVVVSGPVDIIVAQDRIQFFERGSPRMPEITGSGCLLTSVLSAFHAVADDAFSAVCSGALFYSVCGEIAAQKSYGPGTFKVHFLDALSALPQAVNYES